MSSILDVGDEIPNFNLDSQVGRISYRDIIDGKWSILVTFGSSFDPVATTDLGMLSKLSDEFEARNILLLAVGDDTVPNYRKWIKDIEELQTVKMEIPLLSDTDCTVLKTFGCARENLLTKQAKPVSFGVFIIDMDKRIRSSMRCSPLIGRNWYEVLRQFDALTLTSYHNVICPANWGQGQELMLRKDISPEEAAAYRYVEIKPWFRLTPCPEL
eukprot:gene5100-7109_t